MKKSPILFSLVAIIILSSTLYGNSSTPLEDTTVAQKVTTKPIAFDKAEGIRFEYSDHMECTYDDENINEGIVIWNIEGPDTLIEVVRCDLGLQATLIQLFLPRFIEDLLFNTEYSKAYINGVKEEYEKHNFTIEKEEQTSLNYSDSTIKGVLLKADNLQGIKFIQEIYTFKTSISTITLVVLTDYREEFDQPTEEFIAMKKLFINSLKLSANARTIDKKV